MLNKILNELIFSDKEKVLKFLEEENLKDELENIINSIINPPELESTISELQNEISDLESTIDEMVEEIEKLEEELEELKK